MYTRHGLCALVLLVHTMHVGHAAASSMYSKCVQLVQFMKNMLHVTNFHLSIFWKTRPPAKSIDASVLTVVQNSFGQVSLMLFQVNEKA